VSSFKATARGNGLLVGIVSHLNASTESIDRLLEITYDFRWPAAAVRGSAARCLQRE
jgi:hypothetical protein